MKAFKVVFLGDAGVGAKTSLISQIISDSFDPNCVSTNGASYSSKMVTTSLGDIILEIWDTPGQVKYRALTKIFYKDAHCIILGYDITHKYTFDSIKNYYYIKIKETVVDNPLIYIIANKIDLLGKEQASDEEAISFAKENNIKYFRVSAKTREGIDILVYDIANSLANKFCNSLTKDLFLNKINIPVEPDDQERTGEYHKKYKIILTKYFNL